MARLLLSFFLIIGLTALLTGCVYFHSPGKNLRNPWSGSPQPPSQKSGLPEEKLQPPFPKPRQSPLRVLLLFVDFVNRREYSRAYSLLSKPLRGQVQYADFQDGADRVKSLRIVRVSRFHVEGRTAEAGVTVEGFEKREGKNPWQKEKYTGEVTWIAEKDGWRFDQMELKFPPTRKKHSSQAIR